MNAFGLRIISSPLALTVRYSIERRGIKKRRKGWRVVKRTEPGVYMGAGGVMYAHPDIIDKLPRMDL